MALEDFTDPGFEYRSGDVKGSLPPVIANERVCINFGEEIEHDGEVSLGRSIHFIRVRRGKL